MGRCARPDASPGAALRLGLLVLLLLGQPGGICGALCAVAHHPAAPPGAAHHHRGSSEPAGPCHGAAASHTVHDQLDAIILAFTPAAGASAAAILPEGPAPCEANLPLLTRHPVPDTPPPRA